MKIHLLRSKIDIEKPTFLLLQETKCSSELKIIGNKVFTTYEVIESDAKGVDGVIGILWNFR